MEELQKNIQDLYDYKLSVKSDMSIYIKVVDNTSPLNVVDENVDCINEDTFKFTEDERKHFFHETQGGVA